MVQAIEPKLHLILQLRPQLRLLPSLGPNAAMVGNMHDASHRERSGSCGLLPQYQLTEPKAGGLTDGGLDEW